MRIGNWLTAEQGQRLWQAPDKERLKGKRDRVLLALLLACGLRRHEAVALTLDHLQQREDHWAIVDLVGKAARANCPRPRLGEMRARRLVEGLRLSIGGNCFVASTKSVRLGDTA